MNALRQYVNRGAKQTGDEPDTNTNHKKTPYLEEHVVPPLGL
jgi:hypothetical protein